MKTRKFLALLLVLAMIVGMFSISAYASTSNTASFTFSGDNNITQANVAGAGSGTLVILDTLGPNTEDNIKTCQIELSPNSTASSATVTLKNGNTTVTTLTANLPTGVPDETTVVSVQTDLTYTSGNTSVTTTYIFTFVKETSYTSGTAHNGVYISLPDTGVSLGTASSSGTTYTYTNAKTHYTGFPQYVSLRLVPGGSNYDTVSDVVVTKTSASSTDVEVDHQAGTYYTIYYPTSGTTAVFTVDYKVNGVSQTQTTFSITMTYEATAVSGEGIYAFLPAPGQFTNEGINTGGWGDAYVSGSTATKDIVNNLVTTGVSLGYFGGYVVVDMGENISNSDTNLYGIDLILHGNAFNNNSEPGCIQVAQAVDNAPGDPDGDGVIWYDISGSLYYDPDTATNASFTYTNPHPSDDSSTTLGYTGTVSTTNAENNVPYTCSPYDALGATTGNVVYNTFHRHAWFPLYANYFYSGTRAALDKTDTLPFATYNRDTTNGSTLTLTGVMLKDATATTTSLYRFGYADVHPKYNTAGYYNKAYNPYAFTTTNLSNWNTYLATANNGSPAGGGDPIDISWAVHPAKYDHTVTTNGKTYTAGATDPKAGQPAGLANIRFVRIYTGSAKMNGAFGEISTEVCGVYKANGTGSGAASITPTVKINGTTINTTNMGVSTKTLYSGSTATINVTSTADYIYVNGTLVSSGSNYTFNISSGHTYNVQIITQDGTESPYVTLLKITR